jgi:hypothetical protein
MPKIEILTVRDPDNGTTVRMWIDGVEESPYVEEQVDPGAGHMLEDWLQGQVDLLLADSYSDGFRTAALEAHEAYESSEYITDEGEPEVSCYHAEGSYEDNTRVHCQWSEPITDIYTAAAALRAHRKDAHPEK